MKREIELEYVQLSKISSYKSNERKAFIESLLDGHEIYFTASYRTKTILELSATCNLNSVVCNTQVDGIKMAECVDYSPIDRHPVYLHCFKITKKQSIESHLSQYVNGVIDHIGEKFGVPIQQKHFTVRVERQS